MRVEKHPPETPHRYVNGYVYTRNGSADSRSWRRVESIKNRYGVTPRDMAELTAIEAGGVPIEVRRRGWDEWDGEASWLWLKPE